MVGCGRYVAFGAPDFPRALLSLVFAISAHGFGLWFLPLLSLSVSPKAAGCRRRAGPARVAPSWHCMHRVGEGAAGARSFSTKSSGLVSSRNLSHLPAPPASSFPPRGEGGERESPREVLGPVVQGEEPCFCGKVQEMLELGRKLCCRPLRSSVPSDYCLRV